MPQSGPFHPDLERVARFFPNFTLSPRMLKFMRFLMGLQGARSSTRDVSVEEVQLPAFDPPHRVKVRTFRPRSPSDASPANSNAARPALLWIHGGGYVMGRAADDDGHCIQLVRDLGIVVVSVDYRLAPEWKFPTPLEDTYTALKWLFSHDNGLGIDPTRIAIGGVSAGGGLTAALAQLALDRGEVTPVFQLLIYPMLDDRTTLRTELQSMPVKAWNTGSNHFGWSAYLGSAPGVDTPPLHAVPARRAALVGLPPAWLGVGTLDLFHDEDLDYARRLNAAGIPCQLEVVEGAFHGFDIIARQAPVSRAFRASYCEALRRALSLPASPAR